MKKTIIVGSGPFDRQAIRDRLENDAVYSQGLSDSNVEQLLGLLVRAVVHLAEVVDHGLRDLHGSTSTGTEGCER